VESHPLIVELVSVNVSQPEIIGKYRGQPILSGVKKRPVGGVGTLSLANDNLTGDRQADLRVHGGPDKAVYAYPSEHLPPWNAELTPDTPFGPGTFGENLTVAGWNEENARIGDVWTWGDAILQICQPRYPCFKLSMTTGRPVVGKRMLETLRNGWYLRVLQPGEVPVRGPITVAERGPEHATVANAVRALLPRSSRDLIEAIASVDALAVNWRDMLLEKQAVESL